MSSTAVQGLDVNDDDLKKRGFRTLILGVHRVIYVEPPSSAMFNPGKDVLERYKAVSQTLPSVRWFLRQIIGLAPIHCFAIVSISAITAVQQTMHTYMTNRMLNLIETGYRTNRMESRTILVLLGVRTLSAALSMALNHISTRSETCLEDRSNLHFEYLTMQATLAKIYVHGPDHVDAHRAETWDTNPWRLFERLIEFGSTVFSAISDGVLFYKLLSDENNKWFAPGVMVMWTLRAMPFLSSQVTRMWTNGVLWHVANPDYLRMGRVKKMTQSKCAYRQECMNLNLGQYIISEYGQNAKRLELAGVHMDSYPLRMLHSTFDPKSIIHSAVNQAPTLYYILNAVMGKKTVSFATISSVQSSSQMLQHRLSVIFGGRRDSLFDQMSNIQKLHQSTIHPPDSDEELAAYPAEKCDSQGMMIDFRNVTFNYSGSKTIRPAIDNVSFTIQPGQLVVIVGANGSGKTSMVKLLTRMHEPTTGEILVDGQPASSFRLRDLRESTATLSQDHNLFDGFSVHGNVALGRYTRIEDTDLVENALNLGGASEIVGKMKNQGATVLVPLTTKSFMYSTKRKVTDLYEELEKPGDVSGGEKQRLVAARTFFRMNTGGLRLLVADEPSAAMDPLGEFELFTRLREARKGKTVIFITHRFGHLTKHADVILCMKEGKLVEQGSHAELIAKKGEYYDLYNVQAQAFIDTETSNDSPSDTILEGGTSGEISEEAQTMRMT